jgi:dihydroneopterin aldolase/2-amino-4-hydroxy-6-hydroxymethyldihydropteridine diphosphokinase
MNDIFISVGSNIDADINIPEALRRLQTFVDVCATSTFYRTEDVDRPASPMFSNGVWQIVTKLKPLELKYEVLRRVESKLGRVRTLDPSAPRTIDLDLVLYGNRVVHEPDLILPDPKIRTRPFIAVPLLELAPHLKLPDSGESVSSLPAASDHSLQVACKLTERMKSQICNRK